MPKLTIADLQKLRDQAQKEVLLREGGPYRAKVTVHLGTCGIASGARQIMSTLLKGIETTETKDVMVATSGCAGLCSREPMITVEVIGKAPVKYVDLTAEKMHRVFSEHVISGNIVKEYALAIGSERTE